MHKETTKAAAAFVGAWLALGAPFFLVWAIIELSFKNPLGLLLILAAFGMDIGAYFLGERSKRNISWAYIGKRVVLETMAVSLFFFGIALIRWLL